jgi:gluconate kinase
MNLLLCFSGQIGSGKSSVSTAVARALGWSRTGFGDYLRSEIARLGGDPSSRQALQDMGQKRVDEDAVAFCRDVLATGGFRPGDDFVIDGVRHVDIFDILLTEASPSTARLVFLSAQEANRMARVEVRADYKDFARASGHPVEAQLRDDLPSRAEAIVNADQPLESVVADCVALVERWRHW